jgi:hypothetical protein
MTTTRTHFPFRIDVWTANGESIVEHVAGRAQCIQARTYIAWTHYEHAHFERTAWCDPGATGSAQRLTRGKPKCITDCRHSNRARSLKAPGFLLTARVQPRISQVVTRRDHPIARPVPPWRVFHLEQP